MSKNHVRIRIRNQFLAQAWLDTWKSTNTWNMINWH